MSNQPLVTIGIPNYNHSDLLSRCIKSVINQSYNNIEILISDNCSTDNSIEVIRSFSDDRIKYWKNSKNLGLYPNWDILYKKSTGEYFKILQADDWLHKDYVLLTVEILEKYQADFAMAGFGFRGKTKKDIIPSAIGLKKTEVILEKSDIIEYFSQPLGSFIHPTTNIIRKEIIPEGYGGNYENFYLDMVFWAKALVRGKVVVIDQILSYQYMHSRQDRKTRRDKSIGISEISTALNILNSIPGLNRKVGRYRQMMAAGYLLESIIHCFKFKFKLSILILIRLINENLFLSAIIFFPIVSIDYIVKKVGKHF